jgi:hypothetical protein
VWFCARTPASMPAIDRLHQILSGRAEEVVHSQA